MATQPPTSPERRDYFKRLGLKEGETLVYKEFSTEVETLDDRKVRFTITTTHPDRERDVVDAVGVDMKNFEANPVVLFGHDYKSLPVGRAVSLERHPNKIVAVTEFATADLNPFAEQVYRMVKAGFLKAASIGFRPTKWVYNEERKGVDFQEVELLEYSIVPVPANAHALLAASADGIDVSVLKDWANRTLAAVAEDAPAAERWNLSLAKHFDTATAQYPPKSAEQALATKYCGCEIKTLHHREEPIPSVRMGQFLSALEEQVAKCQVDDLRNIGYDGKEIPPLYEKMQLNSKLWKELLIDGTRFMKMNGTPVVVRVEPRWFGLMVTTYAARQDRGAADQLLDDTFQRASELKFLKGEAFSLSGQFLERGGESMDDLFLSEKNQQAVTRAVGLIEEKGGDLENRGMLLVGPPGTGKTLSGRILMNKAPATFLWISARDFWYAGAFGALANAFQIARENAPTVLFIEDVDNWLSGIEVDLLKTEMDGISQSKGVVTILTTNYPELLPKALIDRPGRFHDVLQFDLPDGTARLKMLEKWLPELTAADAKQAVDATAGYSGAHMRELARFATIIAGQEKVSIKDAMSAALAKLKEQRDLITQVQTQGSRYRAPEVVLQKSVDAGVYVAKEKPVEQAPPVPLRMTFLSAMKEWKDGDDARAERLFLIQTHMNDVEKSVLEDQLNDATDDKDAGKIADAWVKRIEKRQAAERPNVAGLEALVEAKVAELTAGFEAELKAGRVLSKDNEMKLRIARDLLLNSAENIQAVLLSVDRPEKPEEAAPVAEPVIEAEPVALCIDDDHQEEGLVLELDADVPVSADDEILHVDADVLAAAVKDALGEMVRTETLSAVNRLRGRID